MPQDPRPLAIVTGASTGIGHELARCCAEAGFDLLVAADEPAIRDAAQAFRQLGVNVEAVEVDLATVSGVDTLWAVVNGRPVAALLANAGRGLGHGFLDQDFEEVCRVIDTNITGTLYLIQKIGRDMRARRAGRILIVSSIAAFEPGTYQAVYNATKAFLHSFSIALRHELSDTGVTVTCLMPGVTESEFFRRADLLDTKLAQMKKADPADVAKDGFEAMMKGESQVISGLQNKLEVAFAQVAPADIVAERHRRMAEPGTGAKRPGGSS